MIYLVWCHCVMVLILLFCFSVSFSYDHHHPVLCEDYKCVIIFMYSVLAFFFFFLFLYQSTFWKWSHVNGWCTIRTITATTITGQPNRRCRRFVFFARHFHWGLTAGCVCQLSKFKNRIWMVCRKTQITTNTRAECVVS